MAFGAAKIQAQQLASTLPASSHLTTRERERERETLWLHCQTKCHFTAATDEYAVQIVTPAPRSCYVPPSSGM